MTRKRIQNTPDDPDKFTLEEMTEKTEEICERAIVRQVTSLEEIMTISEPEPETLSDERVRNIINGVLLYYSKQIEMSTSQFFMYTALLFL
jgi:hypothetical protein